ncbi:MAG: hypothetical protein HPY90_04895 [Syntrophothermus sp.]|uniref:LolA family protein n=1 Tax=Syntrophothermus sp. TaxID=2736299 RepID=UPI00257D0547|nr:hypothetical protein [Syntrophothermus sp.]NSW82605.1 hypothetical protein [Syntrophothermus sp.]
MLKKIRVYSAVLLAMILCFSLTGCGPGESKNEPQGQSNQPSTKTQVSEPAKEESLSDVLAKGQGLKSMSYEFILTTPQGTQTGKVWLDGNRLKTDSTIEGKRIVTFFDRTTNTVITYYPEQNQAVKLSAGTDSNEAPSPTDYTGNLNPNKVKVIRTEIYDGARCKVLEMIAPSSQGEKVLLWVREDLGLPVRVETTAASGEKTIMEYKNIYVGSLPADTFELPPGVQVTDLNSMMNKLPVNLPNR